MVFLGIEIGAWSVELLFSRIKLQSPKSTSFRGETEEFDAAEQQVGANFVTINFLVPNIHVYFEWTDFSKNFAWRNCDPFGLLEFLKFIR